MKVAVTGLWHLGSVTAACLAAAGHDVMGYDPDAAVINQLQQSEAPVYEPGLNALLAQGKQAGKLQFSADVGSVGLAEVVWVTFDTPVDNDDIADIEFVVNAVASLFPVLQNRTLIIVSSQLPVGSVRRMQALCQEQYPDKYITFACSPENLRLGKAIEVFSKPDRVIVGLQTETDKDRIQVLLKPFTQHIVWMSLESAEMTKHALNSFLATSVVFINEIATLCEQVGADAREVELGLKSEDRIGPKAYLRPGNAIAGGTLARDVNYLIQMSEQKKVKTPLFSALLASNHEHKQWSCRRMLQVLQELKNKTIAILGLTYKVGTDTLRRSAAVEISHWLTHQGAKVVAYDPVIRTLPSELATCIQLKTSLNEVLQDVDAVFVATEWPEFSALSIETLLANMKQPCVFDASGFLAKILGNDERVRYFSVGRQA